MTPVHSRAVRAFVVISHRHLPPPQGQIFAVGVADHDSALRGIAIVGRPVARHLDNG
ncbi:XF1762 family protein [Kitasatospora sp. cg17-2]